MHVGCCHQPLCPCNQYRRTSGQQSSARYTRAHHAIRICHASLSAVKEQEARVLVLFFLLLYHPSRGCHDVFTPPTCNNCGARSCMHLCLRVYSYSYPCMHASLQLRVGRGVGRGLGWGWGVMHAMQCNILPPFLNISFFRDFNIDYIRSKINESSL